jgi:hypothetical protein
MHQFAVWRVSNGSNPEILTTSKCFPVYPELRTSASVTGMSQKCQGTKSLRDSLLRGAAFLCTR